MATTETTQAKTKVWTFDKVHSKIGFSISHLMVSEAEGQFKNVDISINAPSEDFTGTQIDFTAETKSIDTNNEMRDDHIRKEDFLNAEKNPQITFKSKSFVKVADNKYTLNGDLTMNGITKNINLDAKGNVVKHPMRPGVTVAGFKVTGELKRADFNVAPNIPTLALGSEVNVIANVQFTTEQ